MKIKSGFLSLMLLLLFSEACSLSAPVDADKFLPQTVGEYKRNNEARQNGSNSWFMADYEKPDSQIFYGFGPYASPQEAQTQVTDKNFCKPVEYTTIVPEILKEDVLKDKTGKEIGRILICRESANNSYKDNVGNYKYKITLSNDKNYIYLEGKRSSLADLTAFAETLPVNSQVDFAALNLKSLIAANSSVSTSADELLKLKPPVKLAKEPYIKGKVLIAFQSFSGKSSSENPDGTISFDKIVEKYGLTQNSLADSYEAAETIIQIACSKGEKIGDYITKDAERKKFPAYASNCKVSIIDKTIPAIIAQKNLVGTNLYDEEKFNKSDKTFLAPPPYLEIGDFIKKLPKR